MVSAIDKDGWGLKSAHLSTVSSSWNATEESQEQSYQSAKIRI